VRLTVTTYEVEGEYDLPSSVHHQLATQLTAKRRASKARRSHFPFSRMSPLFQTRNFPLTRIAERSASFWPRSQTILVSRNGPSPR